MPVALTIAGFILVVLALAAIFYLCHQEKYSFLKKVHREQKFGIVITTAALVWGGMQGYILTKQDYPSIASAIPIIVPGLILGIYFFMDYIFTRAIGGLLIMFVCELFFASQKQDMPGRFVFSLGGYILALGGMYMIGQPWRFRNLLFKAVDDADYGKKIAATLVALSVVIMVPFSIGYF